MARATTSLPVPDSPRIRTVESCSATWRMRAMTPRIAGEVPVGKRTRLRSSSRTPAPRASSLSAVGTMAISLADIDSPARPEPWQPLFTKFASGGVKRLLTRSAHRDDRVTGVTASSNLRRMSLRAARLAAFGDLPAVAAEGEFLDEIGDHFSGRREARLDLTVGRHVRDPADQSQRLGKEVAQIDLGDALRARLGQRRGCAPHGAERVEADRHGGWTRPVRHQELADEVEQ